MARPTSSTHSNRSVAHVPMVDPIPPLESDPEQLSAASTDGDSILDSVGRHLGPVPWWLVSTLFHTILFVLFILLMADIPKDTTIVTIQGSPVEQIEPPKEEPEKK